MTSIAVVIPCYKVRAHVLDVIERMPTIVNAIYCVDDHCPENSGRLVLDNAKDPRVKVIFREHNGGVGAAVCSGYQAAIDDGHDICVKVDGDGQMAPESIGQLVSPIQNGIADYTKGNRFFNIEDVLKMPKVRLIGNAGLSFLAKISSGYWDIFDPTNGFTAIHSRVLERIPFNKLAKRYFFETDLLFRLGSLNARVVDVPMASFYGEEVSNLKISRVFFNFLLGNIKNFMKRMFYNYILRDFSLGSVYLLVTAMLMLAGSVAGVWFWIRGIQMDQPATPGQVMFSALPLIFGLQIGLSFLGYDISRTPRMALHPLLQRREML